MVAGGSSEQAAQIWGGETWLYQLRGQEHVAVRSSTLTLEEGCCCIVNPNVSYDVSRASGSVGLIIRMDPQGNAKKVPGQEDTLPPTATSTVAAAPAAAFGAAASVASDEDEDDEDNEDNEDEDNE